MGWAGCSRRQLELAEQRALTDKARAEAQKAQQAAEELRQAPPRAPRLHGRLATVGRGYGRRGGGINGTRPERGWGLPAAPP